MKTSRIIQMLCLFAIVALLGLGGLKKPKVSLGPDGKSEHEGVKTSIMNLKGQTAVMFGLNDKSLDLSKEFSVTPGPDVLGNLNMKEFQGMLTDCWKAPLEKVKDFKGEAVDLAGAAKQFKKRAAYKDLKATKSTLKNVTASVKACPAAAKDRVAKTIKGTNEKAKAFVQQKLDIMHQVKVIVLQEVPEQSKTLVGKVPTVVKDVTAAEAKVKGYVSANKNAKGYLQKIQTSRKELDSLQKMITSEGAAMPGKAAETAKQMLENIKKFGQK